MRKLRICIITDETDTQLAGYGTYTLNLVKHLLKEDRENEYYLVHRKKEEHDIYSMANEIIIPSGRFPFSTMRNFVTLPLKLKRQGFDIVHHTSSIGPFAFNGLLPGRKNFQSILDVIPLINPKAFEWQVRMSFKHLLPRIARNVDHIFTISQKSKEDIIERLGVPPEKIEVAYPACTEGLFKPKADRNFLDKKYGIKGNYILFVSTLEEKKNALTLLKAYSLLRATGSKQMLVMVGKKGYGYSRIVKEIRQLEILNNVIMPGYVPAEDLPKFYSTADALVLPSIYEGFGIPVVEANLCGCPVIVSNGGSLPEVAGKSGIVVNTYDYKGYASAIEAVSKDKNLRKRMARLGFENAKRFSWKETAKKTIAAYKKLT